MRMGWVHLLFTLPLHPSPLLFSRRSINQTIDPRKIDPEEGRNLHKSFQLRYNGYIDAKQADTQIWSESQPCPWISEIISCIQVKEIRPGGSPKYSQHLCLYENPRPCSKEGNPMFFLGVMKLQEPQEPLLFYLRFNSCINMVPYSCGLRCRHAHCSVVAWIRCSPWTLGETTQEGRLHCRAPLATKPDLVEID